jgi:hypothetical protein
MPGLWHHVCLCLCHHVNALSLIPTLAPFLHPATAAAVRAGGQQGAGTSASLPALRCVVRTLRTLLACAFRRFPACHNGGEG